MKKERNNDWYLQTAVTWKMQVVAALVGGLVSAGLFSWFYVATLGWHAITDQGYVPLTGVFFLVGVALSALLCTVLLDMKKTEVKGRTVIFDLDDGTFIAEITTDRYLWTKRWEKFVEGRAVEKFEKADVKVRMICQPITDSPKVQEIFYAVVVSPFSTVAEFARQRQWHGVSSVAKIAAIVNIELQRELYNFNSQHSKELATFFNPLIEEQQVAFQKLVFDYLDPLSGKLGVKLVSARFRLKDAPA